MEKSKLSPDQLGHPVSCSCRRRTWDGSVRAVSKFGAARVNTAYGSRGGREAIMLSVVSPTPAQAKYGAPTAQLSNVFHLLLSYPHGYSLLALLRHFSGHFRFTLGPFRLVVSWIKTVSFHSTSVTRCWASVTLCSRWWCVSSAMFSSSPERNICVFGLLSTDRPTLATYQLKMLLYYIFYVPQCQVKHEWSCICHVQRCCNTCSCFFVANFISCLLPIGLFLYYHCLLQVYLSLNDVVPHEYMHIHMFI